MTVNLITRPQVVNTRPTKEQVAEFIRDFTYWLEEEELAIVGLNPDNVVMLDQKMVVANYVDSLPD